ncbi:protein of unknown function DUF641, plant [Dillenia turbinata]|uniref:DUF641 domain-containing protein n=1 Tax=Dillenia turbinata TaxID=194707 RepID=A0AAN8UZE4_9MAGN
MFQKFALAFKTKTIEFFAEDDEIAPDDSDEFAVLDSSNDFITNQKVVVIKPDNHPTISLQTLKKPIDPLLSQNLISSIFATVSSFEASYLQFQTAHVPFDEEAIRVSDKALISNLRKLSDFKQFYHNCKQNTNPNPNFSIGSFLESQVQENQNKLRALENVVNRLQSEIDVKVGEVYAKRQVLGKIQKMNSRLLKRLSGNSNDILLTVSVFDSVLRDSCRCLHSFTKLLINLMKRVGWDVSLAANSVYSDVVYGKKGHNRYALLSYVCLGMFQGFDSEDFGLCGSEIFCNGNGLDLGRNSSMKQLAEHLSNDCMELLSKNPKSEFSKFCEKKYQLLIHPTMESSIFCNLDKNELVLNSWRSLTDFYESFVKMANSIWILHKLAFLFDPDVKIFQVERGVEFSMVYMEDVTKKSNPSCKIRSKVGFTVVPGFRVGGTVIQSQVYLTDVKCTEL